MTTIILSPHFDDAVFSAWTFLQQPDTHVINVFTDCGQETERRAAEDREALKEHYSRGAVTNLGLAEQGKAHPEQLAAIIETALKRRGITAGTLLVPCAFGWHPHGDHRRLREGITRNALALGSQLYHYADFPYWLQAFRKTISSASANKWFRSEFDKRYGRNPDLFIRLDREKAKRKLEAMLCYMGEIERFADIKKGLHSGAWTEEAYWRVR